MSHIALPQHCGRAHGARAAESAASALPCGWEPWPAPELMASVDDRRDARLFDLVSCLICSNPLWARRKLARANQLDLCQAENEDALRIKHFAT
jgi:hypothetical protein